MELKLQVFMIRYVNLGVSEEWRDLTITLYFLLQCTVLAIFKGVDVLILIFSFQNHQDNHKNSMAGQTFILELAVGDRIQVYMYTFTGLHDKPSNHLTQFSGLLLKPVDHIVEPAQPMPERSSSAMSGSYLSLPSSRARSVLSSERF